MNEQRVVGVLAASFLGALAGVAIGGGLVDALTTEWNTEMIAPGCGATVGFTDPTDRYSEAELLMFAQLWNGPATLCDLTRYMECANWGQVTQRALLVRERLLERGITLRDRVDSALMCAPYPWESATLPPWGVARRSGY